MYLKMLDKKCNTWILWNIKCQKVGLNIEFCGIKENAGIKVQV